MNKKKTEGMFIPPRADVAFKELMRLEDVRRHFISDVLDIPIEEIKSVRLENSFLGRHGKQEKQCILDIRMQLNDDRRVNVELQIRRLAYWDKRSLFYLAKMYTDNLFNGQRYDRLKKCIVISVLDFSGDEHPGYHKIYHLRDREGRLYSDQFEVHIIELNKELTGNKIDDWIRLFRVENRKELDEMQSKNAGVMRAVDEVRLMNLNRWLKARYEARQKDQRDRWALEDAIKEDGYNEGMAQGITIGEAQGITIGEARGDLYRSRQMILDLLEDLGEIPKDIRDRICTEESTELLRRWHKAAARAENFNDFRIQMK